MAAPSDIVPAAVRDAHAIAVMSRDLVETGLEWSWTPERVAERVRDREASVIKAVADGRLAGFAIMGFGRDEAHLDLLAVRPAWRRRGLGRRLVGWLETSALVAGIGVVRLEVRANNEGARRFYERLGYSSVRRIARYYCGRETACEMARDLWRETADDFRSV